MQCPTARRQSRSDLVSSADEMVESMVPTLAHIVCAVSVLNSRFVNVPFPWRYATDTDRVWCISLPMNLTSSTCHVCCVEVRKQFGQGVMVLLWCVREEVLHTIVDLVDWKERQRVDHTAEVFDVCRDTIVPGLNPEFFCMCFGTSGKTSSYFDLGTQNVLPAHSLLLAQNRLWQYVDQLFPTPSSWNKFHVPKSNFARPYQQENRLVLCGTHDVSTIYIGRWKEFHTCH